MASREAKAGSNGLITAIRNMPDTKHRPGAMRWSITTDRRVSAAEIDAHAAQHKSRLVEYDEHAHTAVVAQLSRQTAQTRDRIAELLSARPWDVEFVAVRKADGAIESVTITRAPLASSDGQKRKDFWLDQIPRLFAAPPGHIWRYAEDAHRGSTTMTCALDPLRAMVPYTTDPTTSALPTEPWFIGVDEEGNGVSIDLANSAHLLIAGATRSGKSVCTYGLLTHVLRMGDSVRLLVADPNDTTIAPFEPLVSWSTSDTHPKEVTEMLLWVRREMDRRKPILRDMRLDKVSEFKPELPMIVIVIDEAANYLRHADAAAAKELNNELLAVVSQGAKYGVRLVLITQRPDSTILSTSTRSQLSARISFRVEDTATAQMVFPDIEDPGALLTFGPGVGMIKEVAGRPLRFRAAFLADHWAVASAIPEPLIKIDVNEPLRQRITGTPDSDEPVVVDMGDFAFSLDDLDTEAPAGDVVAASLKPAPEFDFSFDD